MKVASQALSNGKDTPWIPAGRFGWKHRNRYGNSMIDAFEKEITNMGDNWLPIKAGIFGNITDATKSLNTVREFVDKLGWF